MAKIYFKDVQGKKVLVEVSNKIAKQYRDSLREEWRNNAYESYYSTSLESITEAGHDFADENSDTEPCGRGAGRRPPHRYGRGKGDVERKTKPVDG